MVDHLLESDEGKTIVQSIIPAASLLRNKYPFTLKTNLELHIGWLLNIYATEVDCQDLSQTDCLMDALDYKWVFYQVFQKVDMNSTVKLLCQRKR